jgi:hypothetical protein
MFQLSVRERERWVTKPSRRRKKSRLLLTVQQGTVGKIQHHPDPKEKVGDDNEVEDLKALHLALKAVRQCSAAVRIWTKLRGMLK